jgi:IclR family transcriptional regulator, pca regulon regulatory protein
VGTRLPAFATSMGRVLLANLPDDELDQRLARVEFQHLTKRTVKDAAALKRVLAGVRKQGYALTDQELEDGLRSVAVPIRDSSGEVVAALNVSVHASRATVPALRSEFLPHAQEAAAAIDAELRSAGVRTRP